MARDECESSDIDAGSDGGIDVAAGRSLIAAAAACADYVAHCGLRSPAPPLRVRTAAAVELDKDTRDALFQMTEDNIKEYYVSCSWGWKPEEKRAELFSDPSRYLLVCVEDGTLVAFTHFQFCFDDDEEPEYLALYCFEVQVLRSHQGRGLGKYMIEELSSVARKYSMEKVMLTCLKANKPAMAFYRKCGFSRDASSPSRHGVRAPYEILSIDT